MFMFYGSLGFSYFLGLDELARLIAGKVNNGFVAGCSGISFISLMIFFWTSMKVAPHADDIDRLSEAKDEYFKAADEARAVKEEFTELVDKLMKENRNKSKNTGARGPSAMSMWSSNGEDN